MKEEKMNHRFSLTERTFEKDAIIAFIDLLGTCDLAETLKAEEQAKKYLCALVSEFDIYFSEIFTEDEIKCYFDVSIFADSIAINIRLKTGNIVERLAKFLLKYQINILLNLQIQSRAIITTGSFFSFKISKTEISPNSILASEFTNIGLCGGLGVIQADKELKGLPLGVYVSEELKNYLSVEQQSCLLPIDERKLFFLKQTGDDNFSPFLSNTAIEKLLACSEISESEICSAIKESYSGKELDKIFPWILANMNKLKEIKIKKIELYTLIIEFSGGTYFTQALANDVLNAPIECIKNWNIKDIENELGENEKQEILTQLKDEKFVPLNGLENIWCGCVKLNKATMMMNLIKTKNLT